MTILSDQIALVAKWTNVHNLEDPIVESWIRMWEERVNEEMRVGELIKVAPVPFATVIPMANDYLELESVYFEPDPSSPYASVKSGRSFETCSPADFWDVSSEGIGYKGPPLYAIIGNRICLNAGVGASPSPIPNVNISYYGRVTPLENAHFSLFDNFPSLYIFGPLTFSAPFLQEDERLTVWGAYVRTRIDSANLAWQTRKMSGGKLHRQRRGFG
jgi:hypothetical protein